MSIDRAVLTAIAEQGSSTVAVSSAGNTITTDRITTDTGSKFDKNVATVAGTIWTRLDNLSAWNGQAKEGVEDLNLKLFHHMGLHIDVNFNRPKIIPVDRDGTDFEAPCILVRAFFKNGRRDTTSPRMVDEELAITDLAMRRLHCVRMEEYGTPSEAGEM